MPFCGHAALEELAGRRTRVEDPILDFVRAQQPPEAATATATALQRRLLIEQRDGLVSIDTDYTSRRKARAGGPGLVFRRLVL